MVGWHHRLDGHAFELAPGAGDGPGGLACCSLWGRKESDTTERLTNSNSASESPSFLQQLFLHMSPLAFLFSLI